LSLWGVLSDEGRICNLKLLLGFASAAQSFSGPSSAELMTIFYCLKFETLSKPGRPGPRIYIHQEQGGLIISPVTAFPSRRLIRLAGLRWSYSTRLHTPAGLLMWAPSLTRSRVCPTYHPQHGPSQKYPFSIITRSLVGLETMSPQSCSLEAALVYIAVIWQWVYMSVYVECIIPVQEPSFRKYRSTRIASKVE
jgi:hypothetical protein